jgi:hypothetical protein
MGAVSRNQWRILARLLQVIGATGCIFSVICGQVLTSYYSTKRPHTPEAERGWTISIEWTHPPSYGTPQEANHVLWLFRLFFPCFGMIALGEAIKIYKLDDYSGLADFNKPRKL